jgi:hypothetical protein
VSPSEKPPERREDRGDFCGTRLEVSRHGKALVMVGVMASKMVGVLGFALAPNLFGLGVAMADGGEQLFAPQPDHPIIESSQRVSDGRKLQHDADGCFHRVEGGAVGQEVGSVAADHKGEGIARGEEAAADSAARAKSSADR